MGFPGKVARCATVAMMSRLSVSMAKTDHQTTQTGKTLNKVQQIFVVCHSWSFWKFWTNPVKTTRREIHHLWQCYRTDSITCFIEWVQLLNLSALHRFYTHLPAVSWEILADRLCTNTDIENCKEYIEQQKIKGRQSHHFSPRDPDNTYISCSISESFSCKV